MNNETLFPCPFCGSTNIDPEGWASDKTHGPACVNCSAPSPLIAPAPVEGLPEGCPETAFFDPMDGQIHSDEKSGEEVVVEIHPVGTRARLASLSTPDSGNPHA